MRMLKSIYAASLLSMAIMSVAGCSSSDEEEVPAGDSVKIKVEMKTLTRMGYIDKDEVITSKWAAKDALRLIPSNGNESQVFTLTDGAGTTIGTFEGANPQIGDGTYTVLFPSTLEKVSDFDSFSFAGQQQDGSSNIKGIAAYHTVKLVSTTSDYTAFSFANAVQSSVMALSFKNLPKSIGIPAQITLTADDACLAATNSTMSKEISLQLINMTASSTMTAYLALGANVNNEKLSAGKQLTVKVTGSTGKCYHVFTVDSDVIFSGGKRHGINVSNWLVDDTPVDNDIIITVPSFGDGVILDDSNTSTGGNAPGLGEGTNLQQ